MRIGVIGLGFMGTTHLKALRNIPGVELGAVASNNQKALSGDLSDVQGNLGSGGERFDFGNAQRYSDPFEAVRDPGVEAVDICLPTHLHAPVAIAALRAGKHVLVEKPMAMDAAECAEMIRVAKETGRILMCAQVLRFIPAYVPLIEAVRAKRFGTVRHALFRRRCAAPGWSEWLTTRGLSGGGVFDLLIHDIDMMLFLFGQPRAVSAWGYENLARGIDMLSAEFHYADGPAVTITGGWHHPKAYPFSMEYTVVGDEGAMDYNSAGSDPTWYANDGTSLKRAVPPADGYEAELVYFLECCRAGVQPERCTPESSAAAVAWTRAAEQARSKKGEPVSCQL